MSINKIYLLTEIRRNDLRSNNQERESLHDEAVLKCGHKITACIRKTFRVPSVEGAGGCRDGCIA
jgi:hypothetical protein